MDLQFHGANCVTITYKGTRVVVDDNLADLGSKSVAKTDDVLVFTGAHGVPATDPKLIIDQPGEYEVADVSINGLAARSHMDEVGKKTATIYKISCGDINAVIVGHAYPDLPDEVVEDLGLVDVLVVPVGGNGYTLDAVGALKVIKAIEPKLVVPTHYADAKLHYPVPQAELAAALKELAMESKETVSKLRVKPGELSDVTQLVVLERA